MNGRGMGSKRFANRLVAATGSVLVLCAAAGPVRAQDQAPAPLPQRAVPPPALRLKRIADPMEDFAGLNYTQEQSAQIKQIHQNTRARLDAVSKDDRLGPEQKDAMRQGFRRLERGQVYNALTPEQQTEVRKRAAARRTAAQKEREKGNKPQSPP